MIRTTNASLGNRILARITSGFIPLKAALVIASLCSHRRNAFPSRLLVSTITVVALLSCTAHAVCDEIAVQEVLDAWRSREQRIHSAACSYTVERTDKAQSIQLPGESPLPSAETSYSMSMRLSVDGSSIRLDRVGQTWDLDAGVLTPSHVVNVLHDGTVSHHRIRSSGADQGFVRKGGPRDMTLTVADVWPIVWFVRPSLISRRLTMLHEVAGKNTSRGEGENEGLLLIAPTEGVEYWVDPDRDFALVRVSTKSRIMEFDYTYEYEEWVPRQWSELSLFSDGEIKWSHNCTVQSFRLNSPLPENEFTVAFVEGTDVGVKQDDGTIRQFIANNSGELIPPDLYRRSIRITGLSWLLLGCLAIGIIASLSVFVRRHIVGKE